MFLPTPSYYPYACLTGLTEGVGNMGYVAQGGIVLTILRFCLFLKNKQLFFVYIVVVDGVGKSKISDCRVNRLLIIILFKFLNVYHRPINELRITVLPVNDS